VRGRGKWLDWIWGALLALVAAAQAVGMKEGRPLSRVAGRLITYSRPAAWLIGALVVWLPAHWLLGETATGTGIEDLGGLVLGLVLGELAHRRYQSRRVSQQESTGPDGP
jgi:hypothetical protein